MTMSSEPSPLVDNPITTNTFIGEADGSDDPPTPIKGVRRLLWWSIPANLGIFIVWGSVPSILLPQQVQLIDKAQGLANLTIIATIGALAALIAQPVAGQISDRTRSRFGRRAPWIVIGGLAGALSLVGLAFSHSIWAIAIMWPLVQITFNFAQGPLSAVMPDRVPLKRRGTFSALVGVGTMVGALGGQIIGSLFFNSISVGYIFFAVFSIVMLTLFCVFNPDYPSTKLQPEPFKFIDFVKTFWVNPIKHPDFFWAFTGRLLLYTGYFAVTQFQLYILENYLHVKTPQAVIPLLGLISIAGIVPMMIISGPISDKVGRRKPFVFAASIVMAFALVLPWVWPTLTSWMIMTFILGLGFGMFGAVDQALMTQVLPSAKSFAKDLGVVNIAATLPQTVAPAVGGAIALTFDYGGLFPVGIVLSILGAFCVWFIKSSK